MHLFSYNAFYVTVSVFIPRNCLFSLEGYSALTLLKYEVTVKVICAWCEREGKETLIGEVGLYDRSMTSHGICDDHEQVVRKRFGG